jgi:hypothetical protein
MDAKHRVIALTSLGLAIGCGLFIIYLGRTGKVTYDFFPFYQARISEMQPCHGLNTETGQPILIQEPVTATSESLIVCARLDTSYIWKGKSPIPLSFLWRHEGKVEYSGYDEMYWPGYITDSLKSEPDKKFQPGLYRVEVYNGRTMLACTEFQVVSGQ